jgi:ribosomal protein S21
MFVEVKGKGGIEDVNRALKYLSKKLKKEGIIEEIYARQEYVKPSKKRNMKRNEAFRRKIRDENRVNRPPRTS